MIGAASLPQNVRFHLDPLAHAGAYTRPTYDNR